MIQTALTLAKKDLLLELRQRHAFYGILLYMASTIFVIYLTLPEKNEPAVWNSIFWLVQLFIGVNAIAKSFLQEGRGRMIYYSTITSPVSFIVSKLLYNVFLMLIISTISLLLLLFFIPGPVQDFTTFLGITLLGGIGISLVFTVMSAIAAKAQQNAALMAILGFPILLPQLLMLLRLSKAAFAEVFREGAILQLIGIISLTDLLVIALAVILFPFLWKD